MAEPDKFPWAEDLAALGERSKHRLRSLSATRASVFPRLNPPESKMRLIKHHPVLAALLAIVFLGVAAPLTYAAIEHVFISVDASESAPQIEQDVQAQLQQQHVNADVSADKGSDGRVKLLIKSTDHSLGSNVDVQMINDSDHDGDRLEQRGLQMQVQCTLTDAQMAQLTALASSTPFTSLLSDPPADQTDAQEAAAITALLASAGFHAATVTVDHGSITVTITAPPQ